VRKTWKRDRKGARKGKERERERERERENEREGGREDRDLCSKRLRCECVPACVLETLRVASRRKWGGLVREASGEKEVGKERRRNARRKKGARDSRRERARARERERVGEERETLAATDAAFSLSPRVS